MALVRLVHFHKDKDVAEALSQRLRDAGYDVDAGDGYTVRELSRGAPVAFVIDLDRLPSHGCAVASVVRQSKALRATPVVFAGGAPEKVERAKALLPDATFTAWARIGAALGRALAKRPESPVVPRSSVETHAPLAKKLGVKAGTALVLVNAPAGFGDSLGELPEGASLREKPPGTLVLWFVRAAEDLEHDLERVVKAAGTSPLWIAWPKKSSGVATDVSEPVVRSVALARGLVDYKVCAIDATWSGLLFRTPRD